MNKKILIENLMECEKNIKNIEEWIKTFNEKEMINYMLFTYNYKINENEAKKRAYEKLEQWKRSLNYFKNIFKINMKALSNYEHLSILKEYIDNGANETITIKNDNEQVINKCNLLHIEKIIDTLNISSINYCNPYITIYVK